MSAAIEPLDDFFDLGPSKDMPTSITESQRAVKFDVPKGVGPKAFRFVVGAAYTAYIAVKGIPSVDQIYQYSDKTVSKAKISQICLTDEFKDAMIQRGVSWRADDYSGLDPTQQYAVMILTNPVHSSKTLQSKLRLAGVSYTQYRAWLKQPTFARYMNDVTEGMISEHQGDLHTVLMQKALGGDLNAIKYVNELNGRFDPNRQQVQDVMKIIDALVEIITQEVTDPEVLTRIANKMSLQLAKVSSIRGEITNG